MDGAKRMRRVFVVLVAAAFSACGSDNSGNAAAPTVPPTPAVTRVISVAGDLNFGQVTVGNSQTKFVTIANNGSGTLTVSGMTVPCGNSFFVSWLSGAISAAATQTVSVRFAPSTAQNCTGVLTVNGDQTAGTNTVAVIATAVAGYSRDLTGRWRGMIGSDTIITLTETGTNLSGTFDSVNLKGNVSGSVSNTGQVTLTVTVSGYQPFTLSGQADDAGNTISGQADGSGFQNTPFTIKRI
jgi:hypothetical protein